MSKLLMSKTFIASAVAGALLLGSAGLASAATTQKFHGMSAWSLTKGKMVKTDCSIGTVIGGQMVCFSSEREMHRFMRNVSANMTKAEGFYREMYFHQ